MNKLKYILCITALSVLQACNDKTADIFLPDGDDNVIGVGDEVQFCAYVPQASTRASAKDDYFDGINNLYQQVQEDYVFRVTMYEEGKAESIATAEYNPTTETVGNVLAYDQYGTLTESTDAMYWPGNVKRYAFHAVSSNSTEQLQKTEGEDYLDQTTTDAFFKQDLIEGYGYVPGWNDYANAPVEGRDIDGLNYLTSKEWYAANKAWGAPSGMTSQQLAEHWKKIPLFMHHRRSRITIRLSAGEGVERDQIAYNSFTDDHIATEIYSYDDANQQLVVKPLLSSYECDYTPTIDNDPENTVITACYDAIVNPHNYAEGANITDQKILAINLSGLKFSFFAANDAEYKSAAGADNSDVEARYNLTEGKHLILDVMLSTDTRKILITAYVRDWKDYPFASVCDDFGNASKPEAIETREQLIEMLGSPVKNQPGKVFVILPEDFNLISQGGWNPSDYELKATLKLAGSKITTNSRLFKSIGPSGSISNGSIVIADMNSNEAPLDCAVAEENYGSIDRLNVLAGETSRKATRAGLVTTNYGTIHYCSSTMPVYNQGGSDTYIGGIAAEMKYRLGDDNNPDLSTMPVIDLCSVNARIDGGEGVKGGGIVGTAEGKLTNNTFEYGITLLQDVARFKNILYLKGTQNLEANGNDWSTKAENTGAGITIENIRPISERYDQVIDSQKELKEMLTKATYNDKEKRIRIADSFTVGDASDSDPWTLGVQSDVLNGTNGNLYCTLNGNNKTITLTGKDNAQMLFTNIQGKLYDLTLVVDKPIEATPNPDADNDAEKLPARAPLAYSVTGGSAVLDNVKVKMINGSYVQASSPAGLVVWAYEGALIQDCESNADVRIVIPSTSGSQQTYFVGGLVNTAAEATLLRCVYHRQSLNTTEEDKSVKGSTIYYGGLVGGTNRKNLTSSVPNLHIADCTSWLRWTSTVERPHDAWGGIIGFSKYAGQGTDMINAMSGNCQGNYWVAPAGASAQGWATGMTEEKVIGKKNSVAPEYNENY